MAKPGTSTPHDDLFRALLSDRERAGAFLQDHLPNEIAGHLQSDLPEIVEGSFIDKPDAEFIVIPEFWISGHKISTDLGLKYL